MIATNGLKSDKFCVSKNLLFFIVLTVLVVTVFFVTNKINKENLTKNSQAAAVSQLKECQQKYGVGKTYFSYGSGIAALPGWLKGDKVSRGYCYYRNESVLHECDKYGEGAYCLMGGRNRFLIGYLVGDKCSLGYCFYKDTASFTECENKYGKGKAVCANGAWGVVYPNSTKGERCRVNEYKDYYCFIYK